MIRRSVTKTFRFSAGHFLPNHNGKCRGQHGHNYRVDVSVRGPVHPVDGTTEEGMILDFAVLKVIWKPIFDLLDHKNLNDVSKFHQGRPTTAETLAAWIFHEFDTGLPQGILVDRVTVWETDDSSATVADV